MLLHRVPLHRVLLHRSGYLMRGVVPSAEKGFRDVKYEVRVAGPYEMSVCFSAAAGGGELPGSPFELIVHPAKASSETTSVPDDLKGGLKTAVGESGSFIIQAMDQFRNLSTKGGDKIKVNCSDALTATCKDLGNGTYEITYLCDVSGVHRMAITIGSDQNNHIRGSPLSVTCESGPLHVPKCELLHSGEAQRSLAGTPIHVSVRARDRFGNETANVLGSKVHFVVELRRVLGDDFDVSHAEQVAAGGLGKLESCEGSWQPSGVYEMTYVPASRGHFHAHVVCVRQMDEKRLAKHFYSKSKVVRARAGGGSADGDESSDEEEASRSPDARRRRASISDSVDGSAGGSRGASPDPARHRRSSLTSSTGGASPAHSRAPRRATISLEAEEIISYDDDGLGLGKSEEAAAEMTSFKQREEVSAFFPMPLEVLPLKPDPKKTRVVNADRWSGQVVGAGTRLLLLVHLRDRFGNACAWVDASGGVDASSDEPQPSGGDAAAREAPPAAAAAAEDGGGEEAEGASDAERSPQPLTAKMLMSGVALSASEARPHLLHITPRDESVGVYETRHALSRSGRFTISLQLGSRPITGSPIHFNVKGANAFGRKSRLETTHGTGFADLSASKSPSSPGANEGPGGFAANAEGAQVVISASPLIGQIFRLQLRARDAFGNPVYSGGSQIETKVIEPPVVAGSDADHILAPKLECHVRDNDTGTYYVDLICVNPGVHTATVRLGGAEVIGSPLVFNAEKPKVLASSKAVGKSRGVRRPALCCLSASLCSVCLSC